MFIETDLKLRHILIWILESFMNTGPGDFFASKQFNSSSHTYKQNKKEKSVGGRQWKFIKSRLYAMTFKVYE